MPFQTAIPSVPITADLEPTSLSCTSWHKKVPSAKVSERRINSYAKGHSTENKAVEILREAGFITHKAPRRRYQNNDFFQHFDIVAKHKGFGNFWIQCKTNRTPGGKIKRDILNFSDKYGISDDHFEIWCWFDRKGFRRWGLHGARWIEKDMCPIFMEVIR